MINNDVLRSMRYLLNCSDHKMVTIIKLAGGKVTDAEMESFLKKEEEEGYKECDHKIMAHFLNGLIYYKRGKDEKRPLLPLEIPITNNIVLKKLRVAFKLRDEDIISLLAGMGHEISKSELSAFFRKTDHQNYRPCKDQFLRSFLKGLIQRNDKKIVKA